MITVTKLTRNSYGATPRVDAESKWVFKCIHNTLKITCRDLLSQFIVDTEDRVHTTLVTYSDRLVRYRDHLNSDKFKPYD